MLWICTYSDREKKKPSHCKIVYLVGVSGVKETNLLFQTFYNGFIVHMAYGNNRKETELNTGIFHENREKTTPIKQMPNTPTINDV